MEGGQGMNLLQWTLPIRPYLADVPTSFALELYDVKDDMLTKAETFDNLFMVTRAMFSHQILVRGNLKTHPDFDSDFVLRSELA